MDSTLKLLCAFLQVQYRIFIIADKFSNDTSSVKETLNQSSIYRTPFRFAQCNSSWTMYQIVYSYLYNEEIQFALSLEMLHLETSMDSNEYQGKTGCHW